MAVKEKIIEYIQNNKKISKDLLKTIRGVKDFNNFKRLLVENKLVTEEELLLIFSKEFRMPFLDLKKYKVPYKSKDLLPQNIAFRYKVLPLCKIGNVFTLATSRPYDIITYDDIKIITKAEKVDVVLSREQDILRALNSLYKVSEDMGEFLDKDAPVKIGEVEAEESLESLVTESKRPPIVRAIDLIIYNALKEKASDIHIEPYEEGLMVKYRIDGVLKEEFSFPKKSQSGVIARLKIISSLDITESRLPQDGRFRGIFEGREIDFRVSALPTNFGEKFVLRILDKEKLSIGLGNLGFSKEPLEIFKEAVKAPFGMILVTGPTGSGKSTTLYSIVSQINTPERNIVTIEDPIEYHIEGITQLHVDPDIGLTFANGLRSILRQSPDIIMVGEIRDSETADIAVKASLTGELIFSTLHTNNAIGAIARLTDMGIEPFLLASSLVAATAQRLVRKLCPKCKEKYQIEKEALERLEVDTEQREFFRPKGCSYCRETGYRGRIAILEIVFLDDKLRDMIIEKKSEEEMREYAYKSRGYRLLKEDGFSKCIEGITSVEEVLRVTSE